MGNGFAETSINKLDKKKYDENFSAINWGVSTIETRIEAEYDNDGKLINSSFEIVKVGGEKDKEKCPTCGADRQA